MMDSTRWSWSVLAGLGVFAVAQPYLGCLPEEEPTTRFVGSEDVLRDVGTEVVVPTVEAFITEMTALKGALEAQAGSPDDRVASQEAYLRAMTVWQQLEVMQLGPAGPSLGAVGGA
ncbi:MAG: hypothetical protein AAGA48_18010, partial [Myxococcota bacterium]